jgi:hypothetical protein
MRRLFEWRRVRRVCRLEIIESIGQCVAARRQHIDLSLLLDHSLTEFLQRALEVGQFDLESLESCGITHKEIISA